MVQLNTQHDLFADFKMTDVWRASYANTTTRTNRNFEIPTTGEIIPL